MPSTEERPLKRKEPIFNVPGVVVAVLGLLVAVHLVRLTLSPQADEWLLLSMAFIPARYAGLAGELPGGQIAMATSFLTHMLLHGDGLHLAFNCAWLLAFGGAIAKRCGGARFMLFSGFCGVLGALAFLALNPGLEAPVIGASGAVAGLMGGTMRFMFSAVDAGGLWRVREAPATVPLMPLDVALRDRRVLSVTGIWVFVNVLAMLGIGTMGAEGGVAWEAHIGGYLAGLLGFGLFDRARSAAMDDQPTLH